MTKTEKHLKFIIDFLYWACLGVLLYLSFKYLTRYLLPLIISYGVAWLLQPPIRRCRYMSRRRRALVLVAVVVGTAAATVAIGYIVVVLVRYLLAAVPQFYVLHVLPLRENYTELMGKFLAYFNLPAPTGNLSGKFVELVGRFAATLVQELLKLKPMEYIMAAVVTLLLTFFISANYDRINQKISSIISQKTAEKLLSVSQIARGSLWKYLHSHLIIAVVVFFELLVGFFLVGNGNALALSVIATLADLLPVVGAGIVVLPMIVVSAFAGELMNAVVLSVLYVVTILSKNILETKLLSDKFGIHPIVTFLLIYLGYQLNGIIGVIFLPIAANVAYEVYNKHSLPSAT